MNIKEATNHIKNTVIAYLMKNENGNYCIPVEKQRPIFLFGPPGIGKTAIMEQIATELNIGLVSYSMTHHTRQSAIGLPFIIKKKFAGQEYSVSEYTMSEIIASVYDYAEKTGKNEGILFLDEINCVSETLAPSMLRFLQYKTFGSHAVPSGWVVVSAGNPPEYNKSVREYDIATLDRIKKIDVVADYSVWKEYALNNNIHPAIMSFLNIKQDCFYSIENTVGGKKFVTARGWEDLSKIMCIYEKKMFDIESSLIEQYIQLPTVAQDFSDYYLVFKKLAQIFDTEKILNGCYSDNLIDETKKLGISEKLGVINMLSDSVNAISKSVISENNVLKECLKIISENNIAQNSNENASKLIDNIIDTVTIKNDTGIYFSGSQVNEILNCKVAEKLNEIKKYLVADGVEAKEAINTVIKTDIEKLKANVSSVQTSLSNVVNFIVGAFGDSPETEIFISNITLNKNSAAFLISFGCESFAKISDRSEYEKKLNESLF